MFIHVVKSGDDLYEVSKQYNVSVQKIVSDNAITDPNVLVVGQSLLIRPNNFVYTVDANDTIYEIANRYGLTVEQILFYNGQITDPNVIYPGMQIAIVYDNPRKEPMEINGFAYPDIDMDVLRRTLPYLTYLSIFSYQITDDGNINEIDDRRLIKEAYRYNVAPILTLTNIRIGELGAFDSDLIHNVLASEENQDKLIESVYLKMREKDYLGVNFDFEYIYPADKEKYNQFLEKARDRLHPMGYLIKTSLAPKIEAGQKGLLYEAHDYPAHGRYVDHAIIMTYEWGYLFGPALPVAPIDKVEEVIQYTVKDIPRRKILMGVPNYGYDFKVPFVEGSVAEIITNPQAVDIAIEKGVGIEFDEQAQSPFFVYTENGQDHEVHFEDPRSITDKINLAIRYDLQGLSYWTIMEYFPQNWLLIDYYLNVIKVI